ncbi:class I SAM-dependent methyltransferase [Alteribacter aurantiacus]|uniref:class I SAM-dependent methyltransferase n=1 Tax=Alteribacter aurantiacus TaxID=254410 RepID=UPI0003FAD6CA|nr:class I SAM-dependent methyltransferase [Alteribacter aurantiacus]
MEKVIDYYTRFDEWGRLDREPIEFNVNLHYMEHYLPPSGSILDNGAGPGKYAITFAKKGYRMTLTDVTPRLVEVAKKKAEEHTLTEQFDGFHVADARDLTCLKDNQFDASFMLGPMYHLQAEKDRIKAVQELKRVTKKGGLVFVAFMPRSKHVLTCLENPEHLRPNHTLDGIARFLETGCFDHEDSGRFTGTYYMNTEDIKPFMQENGFETLELIGSNVGAVIGNDALNKWREKGEDHKLIQLLAKMARDPSTLGVSSHLLYIGKVTKPRRRDDENENAHAI